MLPNKSQPQKPLHFSCRFSLLSYYSCRQSGLDTVLLLDNIVIVAHVVVNTSKRRFAKVSQERSATCFVPRAFIRLQIERSFADNNLKNATSNSVLMATQSHSSKAFLGKYHNRSGGGVDISHGQCTPASLQCQQHRRKCKLSALSVELLPPVPNSLSVWCLK